VAHSICQLLLLQAVNKARIVSRKLDSSSTNKICCCFAGVATVPFGPRDEIAATGLTENATSPAEKQVKPE